MSDDDWKERMGVGQRQYRYGRHVGTTKTTTVIGETGRRAGWTTEHWSGRVDSTATPPHIRIRTKTEEVD